jgi:ubiquinone/menaquinone biosynthesis C-methylase UbiE
MSKRILVVEDQEDNRQIVRLSSRIRSFLALPFPDASFDVVVSTFGVMFTADQEKAAAELLRVCRPGGKIGLANWTPEVAATTALVCSLGL